MNVVLDDAVEEKAGGEKVRLGMVVGFFRFNCNLVKIYAELVITTGHPRKFGRYA